MSSLYDRADLFDLFSGENQYNAVREHWKKILDGTDIHTLLDVSIGTGNLTLPAAELGVQLYGSDLSQGMLEKCREKAEQRGMSVDLRVCDFRRLRKCLNRWTPW